MPPAASILDVEHLTVHYGKRVAVDDLSLSLRGGEIVALLGPNGAGKSTTLLAMAGALAPSRGTIRIGSIEGDLPVPSGGVTPPPFTPPRAASRGWLDAAADPLGARARVGFADQPPSLYEFFTVAEHLAFVGEARGGSDRAAEKALLEDLGLGGIADRLCRELSFGMRQRVGLAAALVGKVEVVLLDETLNGLDPRAAKQARDVLGAAAARGVAVLMSTHLLGVAERLCHRIIVMDGGKMVVDLAGDELAALLARGAGAVEELYLANVADVGPS